MTGLFNSAATEKYRQQYAKTSKLVPLGDKEAQKLFKKNSAKRRSVVAAAVVAAAVAAAVAAGDATARSRLVKATKVLERQGAASKSRWHAEGLLSAQARRAEADDRLKSAQRRKAVMQ
jgi:hypothetical protein